MLQRNVEANGVVAAGAPVMTLSDMSESFVLSAGLADRDALRVALGDTAEVSFDAFPDQVFRRHRQRDWRRRRCAHRHLPGQAQDRREYRGAAEERPGRPRGDHALGDATASHVAIPVDAILEGHGDQAMVFVVDPATGRREAHPHFHRPPVRRTWLP